VDRRAGGERDPPGGAPGWLAGCSRSTRTSTSRTSRDDETEALVAYLKSVKAGPIDRPAARLENSRPGPDRSDRPEGGAARGASAGQYLAGGAAHCADCHTPRRFDGSPDDTEVHGGRSGAGGQPASNITSHLETGIGRWSEAQIARFLKTE